MYNKYVIQSALKLTILLPPLANFWDYRHVPHLASSVTCRRGYKVISTLI